MTKMVVFDMAGTTVDEDNVVYKTLREAFVKKGYEVSLELVLQHGAGKEKYNAVLDILKIVNGTDDLSCDIANVIFQIFQDSLNAVYDDMDVKSFAYTTDVFQYLKTKNVKVVLNTGYNRQTANQLLKKLNWQSGEHFDLLVTADDVQNNRPYPDMILLAMKKLNITDPSTVIKVGDSAIDIEEGRTANCGLTIGVTTGAQNEDQLKAANPDYIFDSLKQLMQIL